MRFLIALTLIATSTAARAEWRASKLEDAFNGDQMMAITLDFSGYAVAFRCSSAEDLALVFITPEKGDAETTQLNSLGPQLVAIVDDQPKVTLDAEVDVTADYILRLTSEQDEVAALLKAVSGAKRRFAMGIQIMDKTMHTKTFDVNGSRRALQKLVETCKLP